MVPGSVFIVVLHCQHLHGLFPFDDHAPRVASLAVRLHLCGFGSSCLTVVPIPVS